MTVLPFLVAAYFIAFIFASVQFKRGAIFPEDATARVPFFGRRLKDIWYFISILLMPLITLYFSFTNEYAVAPVQPAFSLLVFSGVIISGIVVHFAEKTNIESASVVASLAGASKVLLFLLVGTGFVYVYGIIHILVSIQ